MSSSGPGDRTDGGQYSDDIDRLYDGRSDDDDDDINQTDEQDYNFGDS